MPRQARFKFFNSSLQLLNMRLQFLDLPLLLLNLLLLLPDLLLLFLDNRLEAVNVSPRRSRKTAENLVGQKRLPYLCQIHGIHVAGG